MSSLFPQPTPNVEDFFVFFCCTEGVKKVFLSIGKRWKSQGAKSNFRAISVPQVHAVLLPCQSENGRACLSDIRRTLSCAQSLEVHETPKRCQSWKTRIGGGTTETLLSAVPILLVTIIALPASEKTSQFFYEYILIVVLELVV